LASVLNDILMTLVKYADLPNKDIHGKSRKSLWLGMIENYHKYVAIKILPEVDKND